MFLSIDMFCIYIQKKPQRQTIARSSKIIAQSRPKTITKTNVVVWQLTYEANCTTNLVQKFARRTKRITRIRPSQPLKLKTFYTLPKKKKKKNPVIAFIIIFFFLSYNIIINQEFWEKLNSCKKLVYYFFYSQLIRKEEKIL